MSPFSLLLPTLAATHRWGAALAPVLGPGECVALRGDLGVGKTALSRALIQALDPLATEVPSPTFTLVQEYAAPHGPVFHFDLYRLSTAEDVWELGWGEAQRGLCLVEWPERLGALLPPQRLDLSLDYAQQEEARRLTLDDRTGGPEDRFLFLKEMYFD